MTANGRIELAWGDGDHVFNLAKIGQVLELEDKCGCGVMEVFERLKSDRWKINDVRETIRLALIGGGKTPIDALNLVKRYVDERPWAESVRPAMMILMASIVGVPDDSVGKVQAEGTVTEATAASSAPPSTAPAPSLDTPHGKPTNAPCGSLPPESMPITGSMAATTIPHPQAPQSSMK